MKYYIMAKEQQAKKYGYYAGYTRFFMKIFNINSDLSIDNYDVAIAVCEGLKEELPTLKFKIKKA